MHKPLLFLILSLLCSQSGNTQYKNSNLEYLTTEDGLSGNIVFSIHQDSSGYLWVGTNEGISVFNGYDFKIFRKEASDSNSIPGSRVHNIYEDVKGKIWVGTNEGLCQFEPSTGKFIRFKFPLNQSIDQFIPFNDTHLLIRINVEFFSLNIETQAITAVGYLLAGSTVYKAGIVPILTSDQQGGIYLIQKINKEDQIWKFDKVNKTFREFCTVIFPQEITKLGLDNFFIDSKNKFWFSSLKAILIYDDPVAPGDTILPEIYYAYKDEGMARGIYEDKSGNIWISTSIGLYQYNHQSQKISHYNDKSPDFVMRSNVVNTTFQDRTGILWVGTFNGLHKMTNVEKRFRHTSSDPESPFPLFSNAVMGIFRQNENQLRIHYLFGTPYYSLLELPDYTIHHFPIKSNDPIRNQALINQEEVTDATLSQYENFLKSDRVVNNLVPGCMLVDDKQNLWYNRMHSVMLINTGFKWYTNSFIIDMQVSDDELWLATENGLFMIDRTNQNMLHFIHDKSDTKSISSNHVNCMLFENNGDLWLGTKGSGLDYFDRGNNVFRHYSESDGLCNNSIYSMVKDNAGRIWLATSKGLSCFDTTSKSFKNYFRSDGLVNSEFNRYSAFKSNNGTIYLGGMDGIDFFHPDSLDHLDIVPTVRITDVKLFNKSIHLKSPHQLNHDENFVSIEFATMDFKSPALNKFSYKLDGIDKEWIKTSNHFASYPALPPGHYRFLVYGSNSNGVWSEHPATHEFMIKAPWWQRWWFYGSSIFAIGISLYLFYRYRINHLRKIYHIRNEISRDLHDQVGATLTSISFLSEVAKKQSTEIGINRETLNKIGDYSREMIGDMNDIVWSINPVNDKFDKITDRMQDYASPLLAARNIQFHFDADALLKQVTLLPQQRKNLYLIFKESINNAAKYAECSNISVAIRRHNHLIQLTISDDGIGFSVPGNGNGNGIGNMKERATAIKGTINIETSQGKGTRIKLEMPITHNTYAG